MQADYRPHGLSCCDSAWPACEPPSSGRHRRSKERVASRRPRVSVMQAANLGDRDDAAVAWRLNFTRGRCVAVERQVGSGLVIVSEVIVEDPKQVAFAEHDYVIQTLAANRSDQPLDVRALPGRAIEGVIPSSNICRATKQRHLF